MADKTHFVSSAQYERLMIAAEESTLIGVPADHTWWRWDAAMIVQDLPRDGAGLRGVHTVVVEDDPIRRELRRMEEAEHGKP